MVDPNKDSQTLSQTQITNQIALKNTKLQERIDKTIESHLTI